MNAASASGSSGGGASVRVATGWPTRVKNSSWPAGAHRHSSREGVPAALVNECGALAGTLIVSPARAVMVCPAERHPHLAVQDGEHLLEVVPVRRRPAAGRDVHVDQGVLAVRVLAGHQDRVRVADQPDVRQALVVVWPRDGELAGQVVGRYRIRLTWHDASCGALLFQRSKRSISSVY